VKLQRAGTPAAPPTLKATFEQSLVLVSSLVMLQMHLLQSLAAKTADSYSFGLPDQIHEVPFERNSFKNGINSEPISESGLARLLQLDGELRHSRGVPVFDVNRVVLQGSHKVSQAFKRI
jgi:hypothetical protein